MLTNIFNEIPAGGSSDEFFIGDVLKRFTVKFENYDPKNDDLIIFFFDDIHADNNSSDKNYRNFLSLSYENLKKQKFVKHIFRYSGIYNVKVFLRNKRTFLIDSEEIFVGASSPIFIPEQQTYFSPQPFQIKSIDDILWFFTTDGTQPFYRNYRFSWSVNPPENYQKDDQVLHNGELYRFTNTNLKYKNLEPGVDLNWQLFWEKNNCSEFSPFTLTETTILNLIGFGKKERVYGPYVLTYEFQNIFPTVQWNLNNMDVYPNPTELTANLILDSVPTTDYEILYTVTGGEPINIFEPLMLTSTTVIKYCVRNKLLDTRTDPTMLIFNIG